MKKIKIKIQEGNCGSGKRDFHTEDDPCSTAAPFPKASHSHKNGEARMHRTTLAHLMADAKVLLDLIEDQDELPPWLEAKITKAGDYMSSAARYIAGNVARDHGQLEEQESVNMSREEMISVLSNLSDEELARLLGDSDLIGQSLTTENMVGLTEEILVESHFTLYDYLQDAIDENNETPCPQCLYEVLSEAACGCPDLIPEAKYRGRTVKLNKPTRGDVKKFKVYVKNAKGNVVKVNFGDKNMRIKKSNPKRRKSFRARHNCKNPGPKWKARYWSCRKW